MRPPIPVEDQSEARAWIEEALAGIDPALVHALSADYLLEARICIDIGDLRDALVRPGPLQSGAVRVEHKAELASACERLFSELLANRPSASPPSSVLLVMRAPVSLRYEDYLEAANSLQRRLDARAQTVTLGFFVAPDVQDVTVRIVLAGKLDLSQEIHAGASKFEANTRPLDLPAFLRDHR